MNYLKLLDFITVTYYQINNLYFENEIGFYSLQGHTQMERFILKFQCKMAFRQLVRAFLLKGQMPRCQMGDVLPRCQMLHINAPVFERLRPNAIPLRSRKSAKSSEDKQGRYFVDNCRVRVQVRAEHS